MKPLAAVSKYHYWSERLATEFWQDNVAQLPNRINTNAGIPQFSIQVQSQDPPQTKAARAVAIQELLADHIVTDLDYIGPCSYLASRSQMVLSSLRDEQGRDTGAVTLFADLQSGQGRRIAVCLFGSAGNVCGCEPTVPAWRQFGWTSSSNNGVELLLDAGAHAEDSKDPKAFWHQAAEEARTNVVDVCWNALNICYGQGAYRSDGCRPWRRGYTIGHYQDVEWLAQIYFTCTELLNVPDIPISAAFDVVHVGAAFWVRSGSVSAWIPYNWENVQRLNSSEPKPSSPHRLRMRFWHKPHQKELIHEPYPGLLPNT